MERPSRVRLNRQAHTEATMNRATFLCALGAAAATLVGIQSCQDGMDPTKILTDGFDLSSIYFGSVDIAFSSSTYNELLPRLRYTPWLEGSSNIIPVSNLGLVLRIRNPLFVKGGGTVGPLEGKSWLMSNNSVTSDGKDYAIGSMDNGRPIRSFLFSGDPSTNMYLTFKPTSPSHDFINIINGQVKNPITGRLMTRNQLDLVSVLSPASK